jgi:hypothetical protein
MVFPLALTLFVCGLPRAAQAQQAEVALLKDVDETTVIILVDEHHKELARLTGDQRRKSDLRWVPDGERLSYHVADPNGALVRLVIVDLKGEILKEIPIEPNDPEVWRPRFIQDIVWLTERKFRVFGSYNQWNYVTYDVDCETGAISNQLVGQGDFIDSPDGKNTAYLSETLGGPDEQRYETIEIEVHALGPRVRDPAHYTGPDKGVFRVVAGPIWSEDSKRVALIEKMLTTDEAVLGFLSVDGRSDRVPLPSHFDSTATLTWLGDNLAVRDDTEMLVVNYRQKRLVRANAELVTKVEAQLQAKKQKAESHRALNQLRQDCEAKEAIGRPE